MYPKRTLNFKFSQFSAITAVIIFTIGILGVDKHFDPSAHLPFNSSLFGFHSGILEIFLSITIALQAAYIYDNERTKHRENYRTLEQIRDEREAEEIRNIEKSFKTKKG